MKRGILVLLIFMGLSACSKDDRFPLRPVSFEIGGKTYYSTRDSRTIYGNIFGVPDPDSLRINEVDGRISISYIRDSDFISHEVSYISLLLKGAKGRFETGSKLSFDMTEGLEGYPSVGLSLIKTSYASDSDLYRAVSGWIEFDVIDWSSKTLAGRFEFKAELKEDHQVCSHDKEIEVKNGTFKNIPFAISSTDYFNNL